MLKENSKDCVGLAKYKDRPSSIRSFTSCISCHLKCVVPSVAVVVRASFPCRCRVYVHNSLSARAEAEILFSEHCVPIWSIVCSVLTTPK